MASHLEIYDIIKMKYFTANRDLIKWLQSDSWR